LTGDAQVDAEFVKWFTTLGVGGVLAGLMFAFYRKDIKQYTELWKIMSEQMITTVKENTASNTRIISLLENLERNSIRKDDIQFMVDRRLQEMKNK